MGKGAQLCRLVMMLRVLGVCNLEQDTDIGHPAHIGLQVYNEQWTQYIHNIFNFYLNKPYIYNIYI